jgi:hypothetical protein
MRIALLTAVLLGCGTTAESDAWHILPDGGAEVGEVGTECPNGATLCSGQCVDTTNDPANCGGCGVACPAMSTCAASACFINDPTP